MSAWAQSLGLWTRWRTPTGLRSLDRPVRYVLEYAFTRGSILTGLDQMYIQVAQTSFNNLLFGGMIGAVSGGVVGRKIFKGNSKETGE